MFLMKRDPVGDRLKELEDNPAKVRVDDEIIRLIEEIRKKQNEEIGRASCRERV